MKSNMDHMIVANYIVIDSRKARSNRARARAASTRARSSVKIEYKSES